MAFLMGKVIRVNFSQGREAVRFGIVFYKNQEDIGKRAPYFMSEASLEKARSFIENNSEMAVMCEYAGAAIIRCDSSGKLKDENALARYKLNSGLMQLMTITE